MRSRRKQCVYPNQNAEDVLMGGTMTLWRNPAGEAFGKEDAWAFVSEWTRAEDMWTSYEQIEAKEREFGADHTYAWDSDFGYLSPVPGHCGTALSIEAEFHLEALHLIGDLSAVLNAVEALRYCPTSIVEDGIHQAAHIFRIRNAATLGISEKDLIARTIRVMSNLCKEEMMARASIVDTMPRILEDAVARSLAMLRCARLLSPGELLDLLSPVRLAATLGFIDGITVGETIKMMAEQLNAPELPPAHTVEDDRKRDARDAKLADRINARFATVKFSSLAGEFLT